MGAGDVRLIAKMMSLFKRDPQEEARELTLIAAGVAAQFGWLELAVAMVERAEEIKRGGR